MGQVQLVASALASRPLQPFARRLPTWSGVLVLNYHRVGPRPGGGLDVGVWSASAEALDAELALLARDFEVVGPADLLERPAARGRRVLITFDDGYRDNHAVALPLLRRHGLIATFFVVPDFVDHPRLPWWDELAWIVSGARTQEVRLPEYGLPLLVMDPATAPTALADVYKRLSSGAGEELVDRVARAAGSGRAPSSAGRDLFMSWDHLRELRDAGMVIGGHTLTHPVLAREPRERQAQEIEGCAARLKAELGIAMTYFSYPVGLPGTWSGDTRRLLGDAGVKLAFTYSGGYHRRGPLRDPLAIPRASVSASMSPSRFAVLLWAPGLLARW